jgi:hypothetical protein
MNHRMPRQIRDAARDGRCCSTGCRRARWLLWPRRGRGLDAGGLGALTGAARDVLLPRAGVTAIRQHPGKVRDARAPR